MMKNAWIINCLGAIGSAMLLTAFLSCRESASDQALPEHVFYTCSMDPQVMEKRPGTCPICKMDLVRVEIDPHQKADELKLSEQQIQLANIQTDTVRFRPIGDEITRPAILRENQNTVNILSARVPGRIERLYVRNTGEPVRAGQPVYDLYSEQLATAQQDYLLALQSQKNYPGHTPDLNRLAEAARNKLLLWGMTASQIAEIEQSGQVKSILTYFSQYAGITTEVYVSEGDYVAAGAPLIRLADLRSLWVEAQLYVSELPLLAQTNEAFIEIPSVPARRFRGRIIFVNPQLEPSSKIVTVRVEMSNPYGEYQPGMQAWMTLKGKVKQTIAVPTHALIQGQNGSTVWLKDTTGAFRRRLVKTGEANKDFTEITDGLSPGVVVVTSGAYLLHSEWAFKKGAGQQENHAGH